MPRSPFPGMDPYLENPAFWRGFHASLIVHLQDALNRNLPPGFAAGVDERCYVVPAERNIYAGVAGTEAGAPTGVVSVSADQQRERFIEILAPGEDERVVAVIELLSPANKALGSVGRKAYRRKQEEVLRSAAHLVEIDLLRGGAHTVAVPRRGLSRFGPHNYLVSLHRADRSHEFAFYLNQLSEGLPLIRVPLEGDAPDVLLDLQAAFERAYDAGPYTRRVDYGREPEPPLSAEDAAWADTLLREKGLRP